MYKCSCIIAISFSLYSILSTIRLFLSPISLFTFGLVLLPQILVLLYEFLKKKKRKRRRKWKKELCFVFFFLSFTFLSFRIQVVLERGRENQLLLNSCCYCLFTFILTWFSSFSWLCFVSFVYCLIFHEKFTVFLQ